MLIIREHGLFSGRQIERRRRRLRRLRGRRNRIVFAILPPHASRRVLDGRDSQQGVPVLARWIHEMAERVLRVASADVWVVLVEYRWTRLGRG